jgi:hypothetical protein
MPRAGNYDAPKNEKTLRASELIITLRVPKPYYGQILCNVDSMVLEGKQKDIPNFKSTKR